MNILFGLLLFMYPHIKTEVKTDSQGVYFVVHAPHVSTDFTLYVKNLSYTKDSVLHISYPDFDLWDREKKEDSVFIFRPTRRRKFDKDVLYAYRVTLFDLEDKNTLSSTYYFFRLNNRGKVGVYPEIYPVMQLLSKDTIGIFFTTNRPTYAKIRLKIDGKPDEVISHNVKSKRHEFKIPYKKGLNFYKFCIYTKWDTFRSFYIPIKYHGKIKSFAIFGDTRANWAIPSPRGRADGVNELTIQNILRAIYKEPVDFVEINGDLITGYTSSKEDALKQYEAFLKALYPYASSIPFLFTPGNHDMTAPFIGTRKDHKDPEPPNSAEDLWKDIFMQPENGPMAEEGMPPYKENVYYVSAGKYGIFFLNSDYNYAKKGRKRLSGNITHKEIKWFLKHSKKFKKTVVIFHEPLYSNTPMPGHSLDYNVPLRDSIADALLGSNVQILLTSHEHLYARRVIPSKSAKRTINQLTIGAGGAPLYNIPEDKRKGLECFSRETVYGIVSLRKNRVEFKVKNLNGFLIDSGTVK